MDIPFTIGMNVWINSAIYSDFGDFLAAKDIDDNLSSDVGIIPYFCGDIRMRDHDDINGIWAETIKIMRSKVSDEALQLPKSSNHPSATPNMSRF